MNAKIVKINCKICWFTVSVLTITDEKFVVSLNKISFMIWEHGCSKSPNRKFKPYNICRKVGCSRK